MKKQCTHAESLVLNSRPTKHGTYRRRECCKCKLRWTTYEVREEVLLRLTKSDLVLKALHTQLRVIDGEAL